MRTETREIYKCDHCNKLYQRKHACEVHEAGCTRNPANIRPCHTCKFITKKQETVSYSLYEYGERERTVDLLFCDQIKSYLYPPRVGIKGNAFETDDYDNQEMPKECKFHVDIIEDYLNKNKL